MGDVKHYVTGGSELRDQRARFRSLVEQFAGNQVHIASLAVHTQATDSAGIVRDIRPTLTSDLFAARANYGLA